jgi:uncharacterized DUF497 family protein
VAGMKVLLKSTHFSFKIKSLNLNEAILESNKMKIDEIIWLQKVVDKLETKHHIFQEEVEQVFANNPQYRFLEKGKVEGENVYSAYGQTDIGRYVTVIFISKFKNCALIISARDMDKKERKQYGKKN